MPRLMLSSPPARASSMGVLISAGLRVTDLSPIHLSVCLHIRGNAPTTRHSLLRVGGCNNELWVVGNLVSLFVVLSLTELH